jgi:glycine cleavage system aminomethyltransferase T
VAIEHADLDNLVEVEIRGRKVLAKIVATPFYRR